MRYHILVLCTGNSCRSQMAEAYLRHFAGDKATVWSAGTSPKQVHPLAIQVMDEDGFDIRGHSSKSVDLLSREKFDLILTVCDHARESCPILPGNAKKIHQSFEDPAHATGSLDDQLRVFRKVRDEIKTYSAQLIHSLFPS